MPSGAAVSRVLAAAALALALASAALGATRIWPQLSHDRARDARLTPAQAERAIWTENGSPLPPALYDFWRSQLRRGDRYYLAAHATSPQSLEQPNIVRAYAAYWLLPAIQVRSAARANVVLTFRLGRGGYPGRAVCRPRLHACVVR